MNSYVNLKKRVLFSQLKMGETYYEYYTNSRDKFVGFDGYLAIFEEHIFFAYKKCKFYELIPFKYIVQKYKDSLNDSKDSNENELITISASSFKDSVSETDNDEIQNKIENAIGMTINISALDRQLFF